MKKLIMILTVCAVLICSVLLFTGCGTSDNSMTTKPSSSVSDSQTSDTKPQSTSEKESSSMTGNVESRTDGNISNSSEAE